MTTAALAKPDHSTALGPTMVAAGVTIDQLDLIKKTIAKDATADELKLYLYDCQRQGVHPLDKLIHFTKRGGKYTPVTSIDFMRIQAANTGDCLGISDPIFSSLPAAKWPESATVTVKRFVQGQIAEFVATARWDEYYPGEQSGHMWKKMPHTMLGKCAEALALRKGFPKQLAGLYAREEMDQAQESGLVVEAPKPLPKAQDVVDVTHAQEITIPDGAHLIIRCEDLNGKGRKKGTVTFDDNVTATVWMGDSQLFDACMDYCQRAKPVFRTLKEKDGYAPTLKGIKSADEHDQSAAPGDWTNQVPPADQAF